MSGPSSTTRALYTDDGEKIFNSQRPVLLTSIEEVATRSDLLDRCIVVWLRAIPECNRTSEAEMLTAFHRVRPRILGALLDAVSGALKALPSTKPDALPRMADFAKWVMAAESTLHWPEGTFLSAYADNRASANEVALEASPVARPLMEILHEQGSWLGTASELLQALEDRVSEHVKRQRSWPSNARSMSSHLKRLAPNLRAAGWELEFYRKSSRRICSIRPVAPCASSQPDASHVRHGEIGAMECKTVQIGADTQDTQVDDAHDANAGATTGTATPHGDGWEEGNL